MFEKGGGVNGVKRKGNTVLKSQIPSGKLTWNPKIEVWKMIFLFNLVILGYMLIFQGVWVFSLNQGHFRDLFLQLGGAVDHDWLYWWELCWDFRGLGAHLGSLFSWLVNLPPPGHVPPPPEIRA